MTNERPHYIAEISANHLGDFSRAKELVTAAIEAGATAVKLQTYTAKTMTIDSDLPDFKISADHKLWGGRKLYELYEEAHTPWEWHSELFQMCRSAGVVPFSTPFDLTAVNFLEGLNTPMYKISSMETSDHALIKRVAETGKPLIISTGATLWDEIVDLVEVVYKTGNKDLTLLVCTSSYPADPRDAHLNRMALLKKEFGCKVGLSDHTLGVGVSIAAIALGATVIEKHFTLRRSDGGADAAFSLEPHEFKLLVEEGDSAFAALGSATWSTQASEFESRRIRRSLYIVKNVKMGERVTLENVRAIRPGGGCSPKFLQGMLGKRFDKDLIVGTPMHPDYIGGGFRE
jgi:pseudaminic acid synthase